MLLKPTEIEYVDIVEEKEESAQEKEEGGYVEGRTVLIGGSAEPIFIDEELSFLLASQEENTIQDDDEDEIIFGNQPIVIGGDYSSDSYSYSDDYSSSDFDEVDYNTSSDFEDDFLYDLETDYGGAPEYNLPSDEDIEKSISLDTQGKDWRSSSLIGKVDTKLLDKIKEYRENIQEISDEKLSSLSRGEDRERLLMEASNLIETTRGNSRDITQMIAELDKKVTNLANKYKQYQIDSLIYTREEMFSGIESEVESIIVQRIEEFKGEAEEHIDETVQYYKKKLESDNQVLSTANNIISRREQILDEAYNKSLSIVEEAEQKAQEIIEKSSQAHEEAEMIMAEYDQKGEIIIEESYQESERIIADANMESGRIIQAAEDQHQDILESATQDGFSVGYQEGKEEALKENSELLRETLNALNKLYAAFPVAARQNEEKIVRISYQISDSILGEPVQEKPDLCDRVFERAIQNVSDLEQVRIKVNPSDLDVLLPKQEYFKYVIPDVGEFIITGDRTINKGNCVITAKSEEINISINTQISILEAVFNEALEQEESGYSEE